MDPTLITLLVTVLAFAGLLYFVFIVRRQPDPGAKGVAGLIVLMFVLAPVLLIVLWLQSDSAQRLSDTGFVPHPALAASTGEAAGVGENPVWVFWIKGDSDAIVRFYKDPGCREGWQQVWASDGMLMFESDGGQRMSLFISDDSAIFSLQAAQ